MKHAKNAANKIRGWFGFS
jgi:hypothetical protein